MIVKNEAHVIVDTLENLCNNINFSYYVISDTGSTDGTQEIIKNFFKSKNISGELYQDEWKNFGYNRSLSLKYAFNKTDYVFIFDADDRIIGDFSLPSELNSDSYYFKFGTGVTYKRILMVNNRLEWDFIGVLHEYINCITKKDTSTYFIDGKYYIDSGKTGNRSKDPEKYKKDAMILEKAYYEEEEKNSDLKIRYAFYCAQSYRDANDKENSIKWYKKRAELKNWEQEVYYSYYQIGRLYNDLNEIEKAIYYWTLSYEADKDRYECLYEIISHYRRNGNSYLAYKYYLMIENFNPDLNNKLFVCYPIYSFLLDYELTIILFNIKKYDEGIKIFKKLFLIENIEINFKLHILDVFHFYIDYLNNDLLLNEYFLNFINKIYLEKNKFDPIHIDIIKKAVNKFTSMHDLIDTNNIKSNIKKNIKNKKSINVFFSITSCKRYDLFIRTINSFLICCKDINLIDYFFCVDDNSSNEDRKNMMTNYSFIKYYFKKEFEKGHLSSMNIIWNKLNELKPKYWFHIEDDWLFIKPFNYIGKSIDFLERNKENNIHQILFNKNYAEIIDDYDIIGGSKLDNDFLLHIKDEQNLFGKNCAYWPHYSFRPSISIVDTILKLGNYNSPNVFFEMDYANKYFNNGYKSAFYNEIITLHIGELASDKSANKKNAYKLNNINQFGNNYKVGFYIDTLHNYDSVKIIFNYAKYNKNVLNHITFLFIPELLDSKIKNILNNLHIIEYNSIEHLELLIVKLDVNYIYIANFDNLVYKKYIHNCKNIVHTINKEIYNNDIDKNVINITLFENNNKNNIESIIENDNNTYHEELNIHKSNIVIGILDNLTSSITYYEKVILNILDKLDNVYFIVYNSFLYGVHDRLIYIDNNFDKNKFINTCNIFMNGYIDNYNDIFDILINNKKIICSSDKIQHENVIIYNNENMFSDILLNVENRIYHEIFENRSYNIINKFNSILHHKTYNFIYPSQINIELKKYHCLIKNLFNKNTFNNNKNIILNILKHYLIWKKLEENKLYDYFIILDDNVRNIDNLINIDSLINNNDFDILFLKNNFDNSENNEDAMIDFNNLKINKIEETCNNFFTYIIHKNCLNKIFDYIDLNGMIDKNIINIFLKIDCLKIFETENIIFNLNKNDDDNDDNNDNLDDIFNKNEYIYIQNLDHYGDDIYSVSNKDINNLKYYFEKNDDCIAFNTYGYFKNIVNLNTLISLNNDNHGLYIHIDNYNKKYNTDIIKKIYSNEKLKNIILNNDKNKFIEYIEDNKNDKDDDNKYICLTNKIYKYNEIEFKKNEIIENLFKYIKNNKNCIAFTTNGSLKNYINISNLEHSDKYNTIIDLKKYINMHYIYFKEKLSFIKIINNFLFIENMDYNGNDIYFNNNYSINEMINYANNNENIICFNTLGFFKNKIDINNLQKNNHHGIYIKIGHLINNNKYLKLNDINTLDIEYKCENFNIETLINNIEKNDYIAFNSSGMSKKNINFENILNIPSIHNNYLCVNIEKYINSKLNNKVYKKVKIICDWCDSEKLCYEINKMTKGSLIWNNIKFTYDDNLIDYYIIFNNIFKDTYYESEKTIIFINNEDCESKILNNNFKKIIKNNLNDNLNNNYYFWKINKTYIELIYETFDNKYNNFYMKLSGKMNDLVKNMKDNNMIDIYSDNDYLLASKYKYAIIIQEDDNIIKLLHNIYDLLISECLCFYIGTNDIFNYINKEICIPLNMDNIDETYNLLKTSINDNIFLQKIDIIKKEKMKILDNYNVCPTIERLINNNK
jgi:hypothetical protein